MAKDIRPIDHDTGSAVATTAGGTAWGGFKWGAIVSLLWVAGFAALGVMGGLWAASALVGALEVTALLPVVNAVLGFIGGLVGMGVGAGSVGFAAVPGTLLGALGGGVKAANQVGQERARANEIKYEMMAEQARGSAGFSADPRFNQAGSKISASTAESFGTVEQLARSRA